MVARGARNLIFEGFRFRHNSPAASKMVIQVSRKDDLWSEEIIFRNNIFHDSYNDDLMKIHNGSRHIVAAANPDYAPADDIMGQPRSSTPTLGAYEGQIRLSGRGDLTSIFLWWTASELPDAFEYALRYQAQGGPEKVAKCHCPPANTHSPAW